MSTKVLSIEPLWRSGYADPHLKFTIEFNLGAPHIFTQLYADVCACTDSAGSNPIVLGPLYLNPDREYPAYSSAVRQVEMVLPLTNSAIERIEEQRFKARYHKIHLKVRGYMNGLYVDPSRNRKKEIDIEVVELRSTSAHPTFAHKIEATCEIASSDWTDKFLDILGLGKYLSIEVPIDLEEVLKRAKLSNEKALAERIVKSAKLMTDAQKSLREGDWEHAVGDVRRALENLEKEKVVFQQEEIYATEAIKRLFELNGFPPNVGKAITMMIDNFYTFTSSAHHVQVKGSEEGVEMKAPFDKEDAQFAVGALILLLNTLAKKLAKRAVG